jgi:hypothetical protein
MNIMDILCDTIESQFLLNNTKVVTEVLVTLKHCFEQALGTLRYDR